MFQIKTKKDATLKTKHLTLKQTISSWLKCCKQVALGEYILFTLAKSCSRWNSNLKRLPYTDFDELFLFLKSLTF